MPSLGSLIAWWLGAAHVCFLNVAAQFKSTILTDPIILSIKWWFRIPQSPRVIFMYGWYSLIRMQIFYQLKLLWFPLVDWDFLVTYHLINCGTPIHQPRQANFMCCAETSVYFTAADLFVRLCMGRGAWRFVGARLLPAPLLCCWDLLTLSLVSFSLAGSGWQQVFECYKRRGAARPDKPAVDNG